MPDFNEVFESLKTDSLELINLSLKNYKDEAKNDVLSFLEDSRENLEKWTKLLVNKEISSGEFEWLVASQKDLMAMITLKHTALAKIRLDQFKNSVLNLIVDSIFDKLL